MKGGREGGESGEGGMLDREEWEKKWASLL